MRRSERNEGAAEFVFYLRFSRIQRPMEADMEEHDPLQFAVPAGGYHFRTPIPR
jgi:hypothetical protein